MLQTFLRMLDNGGLTARYFLPGTAKWMYVNWLQIIELLIVFYYFYVRVCVVLYYCYYYYYNNYIYVIQRQSFEKR